MENTDKLWNVELQKRVEEAKKKAFSDEIKRIEKDVNFQAHSIVQKYFAEQEASLKDTLQKASAERQVSIEKLQLRKGDIQRLLAVERRKKEEARKKAEEEHKRVEEAERKRKAEEEKKRRQQEEQERKERIQTAVEKIRSFYSEGDLDQALIETQQGLEFEPTNEDLKVWEKRIYDSREKRLRDEEAALARQREIEQKARKQKIKTARRLTTVVIVALLAILIYEFQKDIFPQTVYLAVQSFSSSEHTGNGTHLGSSFAREIADKMSSFGNVTVMGSSSIHNIERTSHNPTSTMNNLGFMFILKGSVVNKGATYEVYVNVVDTSNKDVWSGHFEQPASSIMQLPEEISLQLAKVMGVKLTDQAEANLKTNGTTNVSAYLLYLKGKEDLEKRTLSGVKEAFIQFTQAFNADPRYANAYGGAASALLVKIENRWDRSDSTMNHAEQLINQSLKFQPTLPMGKVAKARLLSLKKKLNDANKLLDDVLSQNPHHVEALLAKSKILVKMGKVEEAYTIINRAYDISPRDAEVLLMEGYINTFKGRFRDAMQYSDYALPIVEDSSRYLSETVLDFVMADPDLQISSGGRIVKACTEMVRSNPRDMKILYHQAQILQVLGKIPEANQPLLTMRSILQNQLISQPRNADAMMNLALMLTRYGSFPEGIDMARRAVSISRNDPSILYKLAQMYSVQMASHKSAKIDETKKNEALKYLGEAVNLDYRIDELADGDFFNLRSQPEFLTTIQMKSK